MCSTHPAVLKQSAGLLALFCVWSREGRAALVASFGVVKYLTLYGLIQFVGTALLFWVSGSCIFDQYTVPCICSGTTQQVRKGRQGFRGQQRCQKLGKCWAGCLQDTWMQGKSPVMIKLHLLQ